MSAAVRSNRLYLPPEELLQYLPSYKVIVCKTCKYAIQPKAIARHLKEIHHMKLSDRQPLMQYVEKFELADHEVVMKYVPIEFPVPLLPVQSGLLCRSEGCTYLCITEKRMKRHWLSVHGRQELESYKWQKVPLQTFFKGNLLRYFTDPSSENAIKTIASDLRPISTPSYTTTLNQSDALLMSHFTNHTWLTLANDDNMRQMWRDIVPPLAYKNQYLMHALLACAALHLAYLNPKRKMELIFQARTHQDMAIPLFLSAVSTFESETCDAVLIFVRIIGITAFALDETSFAVREGKDRLPNWLFFIQSGCTMFCDVWSRMGTGPVRYLIRSWELLDEISKSPNQPLLDYFLAIPSDNWSEEERVPYSESALALAQNFSALPELDDRITTLEVVRFWPIKNSVEFVKLLENWHPGALILLAHYCIILHRMSASTWALRGIAGNILSIIWRKIDADWREYIEWPLREVGHDFTTHPITNELLFGSLGLSVKTG